MEAIVPDCDPSGRLYSLEHAAGQRTRAGNRSGGYAASAITGAAVTLTTRSSTAGEALRSARQEAALRRPLELGQYVSLAFGRRCRLAGIELSMGSRGSAYDNAVCEAFFKTLKAELVDRRSWPTKAEARTAVFEFIECFYNRRRRHSTLGYLTPDEYERINEEPRAA